MGTQTLYLLTAHMNRLEHNIILPIEKGITHYADQVSLMSESSGNCFNICRTLHILTFELAGAAASILLNLFSRPLAKPEKFQECNN